MNDWQPIDTAPKDGYPIWAKGQNYGKPDNGEHFCWTHWDGSNWIEAGVHDGQPATLLYLTHWMLKS